MREEILGNVIFGAIFVYITISIIQVLREKK